MIETDSKVAIIAGSSGLIGSHLISHLLANDIYKKVISVSRRPLEMDHHKLVQKVIDFENLPQLENELVGDHVFCCLGSTRRKAGSKENFFRFDYNYPMELAAITSSNGASLFSLVSSRGANKNSMFFYSRVKGELEESISKIEFRTIQIFRPSLLMGKRNEIRPAEKAGEYISYLFYPFFGLMNNVRPIKAEKVARAMMELAFTEQTGVHVYESGVLQSY